MIGWIWLLNRKPDIVYPFLCDQTLAQHGFDEDIDRLNERMALQVRLKSPGKYDKVAVLLLSWEKTGSREEGPLKESMTNGGDIQGKLRFEVEPPYAIPHERTACQDELDTPIRIFRNKYRAADNLCIVYYTGQGAIARARTNSRGLRKLPFPFCRYG